MSGKKVVLYLGLAIGISMLAFIIVILTQRALPPVSEMDGKPTVKCAGLALGTGEGQQQAIQSLLTGFEVKVPGMEEVFTGQTPVLVGGAGPIPGHEGGQATWLELVWTVADDEVTNAAFGARILCVDGMARSVTAIRVPLSEDGPAVAEVLPLEQKGEAEGADSRALWRRRCASESQGGVEARFCQVEAHAPGALQVFMPALRYVAHQQSQATPDIPLEFGAELKELLLTRGEINLIMEVSLTYPRLDAACLEAGHFQQEGATLMLNEGCSVERSAMQGMCVCGPFPAVLPPKGLRDPVGCRPQGGSSAALCRQISTTVPLDVAIANHLD